MNTYKHQFLLFSLSLLVLVSCGDKAKNNAKDIKTVPVYKVTLKDTIVSSKFVADVHAKNNVEIHVRIPGLLDKVYVSEGQKVKKGQILFKISDVELQIQLLKAEAVFKTTMADLRIATVELEQAQTLFNKKVIADKELELSKAKYDAAAAKVAHAAAEKKAINQQINFTTIRAPFDGTVDRIPFKEGSLVENGSLLTTVSQLDDIYAYFSIPENTYFQMMEDKSLNNQGDIKLVLPNGMVYDQRGELRTADGEIDRETGSIQYKAKFHNPQGFIKHGTSGKLIISEPKTNAILIPQKAVFSIQDKQYVFLVNKKDGKVKMTNITIGSTLDDVYILNDGLKSDDLIVEEGTQSLRDGDKINIKQM
ncbi:efflux RND transporter periplasmic adaptor subunit [Flavobacterium hungaricum]|uniref:Efflux RND transporter periplasmic adaptor subunit n=1 Tax=Flavobacterium hungaricum TaxID=2082725 RepID=A0ABR9TSF7_9FLAO|nr:efflux RND transporter periplasmic adaptor subunit [Flavobacterium hungaricum]MBE8728298.1 efflux RND transporter periplasmic adaptor subunit [Flavobacterium hungaricum]